MRCVVSAVALATAAFGWSLSLSAAPVQTATIEMATEGETTSDRLASLAAIVADVDLRVEAARDPVEKAFLSQISGHYREFDAEPLWTSSGGLTDAGRALYDELAQADVYGLDPTQFRLPVLPIPAASVAARAAAEVDLSISAVRYAWHARGGRVDATQLSRWLDASPTTIYAGDVFRAIAAAGGDPVEGLRSFHPKHPQFELLRQAYLEARGDVAAKPLPVLVAGSRIDVGMRHPDVILIRQRLGLEVTEDADLLDRRVMRAIRATLDEFGLRIETLCR